MISVLGRFRFKKLKGETFHQTGQKVWLCNKKFVSVRPKRKKTLGLVAKDSVWPDMWTTVEVHNKSDFADWWNEK